MKQLLALLFLIAASFGCGNEQPASTLDVSKQTGEKVEPVISKIEAEFVSPIDGKAYAVPGGWKTFQPEGGVSGVLLQKFYDDLISLDSLAVSNGEVVFQVVIDVGEVGR